MKEYNGLINLDYPDDEFCIYIIYSSNTNDNSIYIGVTEDYKQRAYKHSCSRKREEYKRTVHDAFAYEPEIRDTVEYNLKELVTQLINSRSSPASHVGQVA